MSNDLISIIKSKLNIRFRRSVPKILQTEVTECGLASLAMVCHYYGLHVDLFNLRSKYGLSSRGATLARLIEIAGDLNMQTRALSLSIDELNTLRKPCILHWDMNHFVVLVSVQRGNVTIHDPAFGRRVMGLQELSKHFTGVALELLPNNEFSPAKQESKLRLSTLLKNISGLKSSLTKVFFLSVVIESVNLLLPVGTQLVMDHVIIANDHDLLSLICIGLLFFILFRACISTLRSWISIVMGVFIDIQWKSGVFEHLMKLPVSYFEKRKLGDIQSRFGSLDVIRTTLTTNIVNSIIDSIMSISVFIMMLLYGGWLVWVVSGFTTLYVVLRLLTYSYYRQVSEEQLVKGAKAGSYFMETLYSIATLKTLGLSESRTQSWSNLNVDTINAGVKLTKLNIFFGGINTFISTCDQVIILWLGASMVINNQMTLGMFVAFNAYRGQFSERAGRLIDMALNLRMLSLHNERVADIVLTPQEKQISPRQLFSSGEPVSIEVRNLHYCYDNLSKPIISDLSFSIQAGESVAIIGPSGVGKTTLMKLMCGILEPEKGNLLVNDLDISQVGINNYRQCIACVLQDDKLLSGSIAENIAGFVPDFDIEWVIECARRCNIHEDIQKMPMGYETLIGELGGSLSGGQKQRVLIARAMYRRPSVIFMDEATSHLDLENETIINKVISALKITRIIISHRPSTIDLAERVISLV